MGICRACGANVMPRSDDIAEAQSMQARMPIAKQPRYKKPNMAKGSTPPAAACASDANGHIQMRPTVPVAE